MTLYRQTDRLACACCGRVYDKDPFGSLLPYCDGELDDCCSCGGEIEQGYECDLCGNVVAESETVSDDTGVWCSSCRGECAYCYEILPRAELTLSAEGFPCCAECKKSESEAA